MSSAQLFSWQMDRWTDGRQATSLFTAAFSFLFGFFSLLLFGQKASGLFGWKHLRAPALQREHLPHPEGHPEGHRSRTLLRVSCWTTGSRPDQQLRDWEESFCDVEHLCFLPQMKRMKLNSGPWTTLALQNDPRNPASAVGSPGVKVTQQRRT